MSIGVVIALAVVPGVRLDPGVASAQGQQLEGSWIVTLIQAGQPSRTALHTYTADGGVLVSSPNRQVSLGHGVWVRTGNREFGRTFVLLRFDDKGASVGMSKVRASLRLNEASDEWVGTATVEVFDTTGKLVSSTSGATDQGKRIRVEAP
jgi:hypothetical protein